MSGWGAFSLLQTGYNGSLENAMKQPTIPPLLAHSYNWAVEERLFRGTLDDYVRFLYQAYVSSCEGVGTHPVSYDKWLEGYGPLNV